LVLAIDRSVVVVNRSHTTRQIGSVRFRFIDAEAASFCRAFSGLRAGVSNRELSKKLNQFATCIG
jgi:hypothetical protein